MLYYFSIVFVVWFFCFKYLVRDFSGRVFLTVFAVSTAYYGVLGPWYWVEFKDAVFMGVIWVDQMERVAFWFVAVCVIVLPIFSISYSFFLKMRHFSSLGLGCLENSFFERLMFLLGCFACFYIALNGGDLAEGGDLTADPIFLIMYQFSDLLIAVILYRVSISGFTAKNLIFISVFFAFCFLVGYRYKIFLTLLPLLACVYFVHGAGRPGLKIAMLLGGVSFVGLLSVLTIARNKFSGVDFDAIADAQLDDFMYGLFAETNIIFGLASSLNTFGEYRDFVGLSPFFDSIVQFVPRFLFGDKNLYSNLDGMLFGLGNSVESYNSATMMPFFAEYYSMGGVSAVVLGVLFYAVVSSFLMALFRFGASNNRSLVVGAFLMAVFMAYYYFSRGSIPQIFKGLVFVCFPYLYLIKNSPLRKGLDVNG